MSFINIALACGGIGIFSISFFKASFPQLVCATLLATAVAVPVTAPFIFFFKLSNIFFTIITYLFFQDFFFN